MLNKDSKPVPYVGDRTVNLVGKYYTDYMIHHYNGDVVEIISYSHQEQLKLDGYKQLTDEQRKTLLPQKRRGNDCINNL